MAISGYSSGTRIGVYQPSQFPDGAFECQGADPYIYSSDCSILSANFTPVMVADANGIDYDFFVQLDDMPFPWGGMPYTMWIKILPSMSQAKEFQALIQTAYATRSKLRIVFPNPANGLTASGCNNYTGTTILACTPVAIETVR